MQPLDKKKARREETRVEEGDEMKTNGQITQDPRPGRSELENKPQASPLEEKAEEYDDIKKKSVTFQIEAIKCT